MLRNIPFLLTLFALFLSFETSSFAASASNTDLDQRINGAKRVLTEIMASPDQSIPEEMLAKCKAIAIFPNSVKGGFIFGLRYGKGVVVAKDASTGKWGPLAFSTLGGGSVGFQIGGQATDLILVILNKPGLESLLQDNFSLSANAGVAVGPVGRHTEAATDLFLKTGMIAYSRSKGLFAGVALDGGLVTQDNKSNSVYYGQNLSSKDILLRQTVAAQPSSKAFIDLLNEYSQRWEKRIGFKA